jgi:hypothetical protein
MSKITVFIGVVTLIIMSIGLVGCGSPEKSQQQNDEEKAIKIYENMIMDNAVTILEKIPKYSSIQNKACTHKDGFFIEDPYNAEWYVIDNKIYAVNGLAKSLTPNIDYAPAGISYQSCY